MTEGNRLYLICASHPEDSKLMLGKRLQSAYGRPPSTHEMNAWFDAHAKCPGAPDCFKLAYAESQNHDVLPVVDPATNLKAAVKLALVSFLASAAKRQRQ
jgi:hypothetical protein